MSYSFEEYDAFLASLNDNANNGLMANDNAKASMLEDPQLEMQTISNPSLSTEFSTDEDDIAGLNSMYSIEQNNVNEILLSPYYVSNSSNSPGDLPVFGNGLTGGNEFDLNNLDQTLQIQPSVLPQNDQFAADGRFIKDESKSRGLSVESSSYDIKHSDSDFFMSSESNSPVHQQSKVKLSKAVTHQASIAKKAARKEKSSHNAIERRYRTNINDKIKNLRDAVPALRVLVDSGDDEVDDHLDGLQPAKKLNKATILSKATEYIKHLEAKSELQRQENEMLRSKLAEVGISYSSPASPNSIGDYNGGRVFEDQRTGNYSRTNKLLLGGLACMVGSGLTDDFQNSDTKGLFSSPVFSYDRVSGFQGFDKPFLVLFKVSLVVCVMMKLLLPLTFNKKEEKGSSEVPLLDDVRKLKHSSIWSSFFVSKSNNEYLKSSIFRALWLKVNYFNSNILVKSVVQVYVDNLWSYLQKIQLDQNNNDYDNLKLILSLPARETINNEEYIVKLLNFEKLLDGSDTSAVSIFQKMISETITNSTLRKFITSSLTKPVNSISVISSELIKEINDQNLELQTLLNPTDSQIDKYQKTLETYDVSKLTTDDLLILYSSIIQNLVYQKKDYNRAKQWFNKLDLNRLNDFTLLGFTSLYMIIISMTSNRELFSNDTSIDLKIEELSGLLRIWVGNSNGSILNLKKRSLLIDYFVSVGLTLNGLDQNDRGITV
jgi:hypothetical protein